MWSIIESDLFAWDEKSKTFSGELSTFYGNGGTISKFGTSEDVGFRMKSSKTGAVATFIQVKKKSSREVFHFIPVGSTIQRYPQLAGTSVVLFND